jgi:hypothetical protein
MRTARGIGSCDVSFLFFSFCYDNEINISGDVNSTWYNHSVSVFSRDRVGSDTHDMNSDVTIYHILFRIRIRIRIQNGYFEFGFTFEYLLDL